jgi:hypothetical protein
MRPPRTRRRPALLLVMLSALIVQEGCGRLPGTPASPSDRYRRMLRDSGLESTALGRDWIAAGDAALGAAADARTPFRESGEIAASEARALAWQWTLARGRRLALAASFEPTSPGHLFVDLFAREADGRFRRVAWLEPGRTTLVHDVERDGTYVVRLQP